jgi:hypothetical protein
MSQEKATKGIEKVTEEVASVASEVVENTFNLLGQKISKTTIYIIAGLLLLVGLYLAYQYYGNSSKEQVYHHENPYNTRIAPPNPHDMERYRMEEEKQRYYQEKMAQEQIYANQQQMPENHEEHQVEPEQVHREEELETVNAEEAKVQAQAE